MACLLVSVRFHEGRYHGTGEWPPSPARLFQALVAGTARGKALSERAMAALQWLEGLAAPIIAAPPIYMGQAVRSFVPNNDLDAVDGDPARVGEIRAAKTTRPRYFDAAMPLLYAWVFDQEGDGRHHAETICEMADTLYQLGRGIDMAWAKGEVVMDDDADSRLHGHGGVVRHPYKNGGGTTLLCPRSGSLASLEKRFAAMRGRFKTVGSGRKSSQLFSQAPKPDFAQVAYDSPPTFLLFDVRKSDAAAAFAPKGTERVVALTERIRDLAAARLRKALPDGAALVDRVFVGQGAAEADKALRIRIVPLPSIGHRMAERSIRRVLVVVPPDCPIPANDIAWAFSGLVLDFDPETDELLPGGAVLAVAEDRKMLEHYAVESDRKSALWRTVTPAALPERAARRRIDPRRRREEAKGGAERLREHATAEQAARQALRHAGIETPVQAIRVQREPFEAKGARAEAFAPGTRFAKERLWHVEIAFAEGLSGPLVIGDGRYLGLGLMAPVRNAWRDVVAFSLPADARIAAADRPDLLRAVRRALMALSRDDKGNVPLLFSGHEPGGAKAGSGSHRHVFLAAADLDRDGFVEHVVVAAPWACDRRTQPGRGDLARFDGVVTSLEMLRAGRLGVIPFGIAAVDGKLTGPARVWESHTLYRPTRHAGRGKDPAPSLLEDVAAECNRRGLPKPEIELLELSQGPKEGVAARLRLRFAVTVAGPIILGRDSHQGGGLFEAVS